MRTVQLYPDPRLPWEQVNSTIIPGDLVVLLTSGDTVPAYVTSWLRGQDVPVVDLADVPTPFLAGRILAYGQAVRDLTGRPVPRPAYNRRALSYTGLGVPVFHLPALGWLEQNKWAKRWVQEDTVWASTVPLADLPPVPYTWTARIIESVQDAREAVDELLTHPEWVFDTETFGRIHWAEFRISQLAASAPGLQHAWVWGRDAVARDDPRSRPLLDLMRTRPVSGHNVKYDDMALLCHFGERPARIARDSRLLAKLVKADGPGGLDELADLVGAGGHKVQAKRAVANAAAALTKVRTLATRPVVDAWTTEEYTTATGKVRRRKVPVSQRPPTLAEARDQVLQALDKPITRDGAKTTLAALIDGCAPLDWWITAATVELAECGQLSEDQGQVDPDAPKLRPPKTWTYGLMAGDVAEAYCALDTLTTVALLDLVTPRVMAEPGLRAIWESHVQRLPQVLGSVEAAGQLVDLGRLAALEVQLDQEIAGCDLELARHAPPGFNPASMAQVRDLLYVTLDLPVLASTDGGQPATDAGTLAKLRGRHPVVDVLVLRAKLTKLQSNYARGLRRWVAADGRIHSTLLPDGTESGRMSCKNPAQQTIPSRDPVWAKPIKSLFTARPGYKIVVLDFKTLELRVLAFLAGETSMIDVFRAGGDLHRQTAMDLSMLVWGSDWDTCGLGYSFASLLAEQGWDFWPVVPKPGGQRHPEYLVALEAAREAPVDQPARGRWATLEGSQDGRRKVAKGINFGIVYGQAPETIAESYGVPLADAERAHEAILGQRHQVRKFIAANERECHLTGHIRTWWAGQPARIRPVLDIGGPSRRATGHGERVATNTRVQGTGADFGNASLVHLDERIREVGLDAQINMMVHDSLEAEVLEADVPEYVFHAVQVMTGWESEGCPIEVDVEVGPSRGELRPWRPG